LRLDFSSTGPYAALLFQSYDPGFVRDFFAHILYGHPKIISGLLFAGILLLSSFGLWSLASAATFVRLAATLEPAVLFFPLLLVANYLVMAIGLAMNTRAPVGHPEEFLNRPVVWAYFGVVTWTAGAAYAFVFGDSPPKGFRTRGFMALLTLSSLIMPWLFGRNLQTFPAWRGSVFTEFGRFPTCLVNASHYIRENSRSGDVIQDSANDQNLLVGALAERQDFALGWTSPTKGLKERLDELASFKTMTEETDLIAFAINNDIAWYLLRPETKVFWPVGFLDNFVFDCDGYRVYRFSNFVDRS
jgi:hypothetical protein